MCLVLSIPQDRTQPHSLSLLKTSGRWQGCGEATCVTRECLMSQRQLAAGPLGHFSDSRVFDEGGELSMVTPDHVRAPSGAHFPLVGRDP